MSDTVEPQEREPDDESDDYAESPNFDELSYNLSHGGPDPTVRSSIGDVIGRAEGTVTPPALPTTIRLDVTLVITAEQLREIEPVLGTVRNVVDSKALGEGEEALEVESTLAALDAEVHSPRPKLAVISSGLRSIYDSLNRAAMTLPGVAVVNVACTAIYNLAVHGKL